MMDIQTFRSLSIDDRSETLWNHGQILLTTRSAILYRLFGFYVEVVVRRSGLSEIVVFDGGEKLTRYIETIFLPEMKGITHGAFGDRSAA